jgi:hypothetical protein
LLSEPLNEVNGGQLSRYTYMNAEKEGMNEVWTLVMNIAIKNRQVKSENQ